MDAGVETPDTRSEDGRPAIVDLYTVSQLGYFIDLADHGLADKLSRWTDGVGRPTDIKKLSVVQKNYFFYFCAMEFKFRAPRWHRYRASRSNDTGRINVVTGAGSGLGLAAAN